MEKNIKEAISIIENVRKSMPECTNKAFLKGALNELNEALHIHDVVVSKSMLCRCECEMPNIDGRKGLCGRCERPIIV